MTKLDNKDLVRALVLVVKQMRRMQKDYFLSRTKTSLEEAKRLERKVDDYLEILFSPQEDFKF